VTTPDNRYHEQSSTDCRPSDPVAVFFKAPDSIHWTMRYNRNGGQDRSDLSCPRSSCRHPRLTGRLILKAGAGLSTMKRLENGAGSSWR